MKCFSVEEERVTKGLPIIPSPFPHIGIGRESGCDYTRIGVSTKFAMSLVVKPRQYEIWCLNSRLEYGCPRAKLKAACSQACPDRKMQRQIREAEYANVLECCVSRTTHGDYLIVESRRGDPRGLVHVKLHGSNRWHLSFFSSDAIFHRTSVLGKEAVHFGNSSFNFAAGFAYLSPAEYGKGILILADERLSGAAQKKEGACNEYLVVMQPGSAFCAFQEELSKQVQVAAYYDGQDVQTFCYI